MTQPMPRRLDEDMATRAAELMVAELKTWGCERCMPRDDDAIRGLAKVAARRSIHADGYEIAKALDDAHGWDCDFDAAECLQSFSSHAEDQLKAAQREWMEANNIQPPFPTGAHIKINDVETGIITGIYKYGVAQYEVAVDNDPDAAEPKNARRIVYFEDARAIAPAAGSATLAEARA